MQYKVVPQHCLTIITDFAAVVKYFLLLFGFLMPKSISTDPNGGLGDWLIYVKKIPNVTVEMGSVTCPLPHSQLGKITKQNSELLNWFVGEYAK